MIKTGSKDLDLFLEGYKDELTIIYGPAGSGKTTLAKLATVEVTKRGGKAVFVDTEKGFSVERLMQLASGAYLELLDKILLLKVSDFEEQCKKIESLKNLVGINLVVVDSIGGLYREAVKDNSESANIGLANQFKILSALARKGIHVIITDQVYTNIETNEINMVGGAMVENWAKCLIELEREPRKLILRKPLNKEMFFRISEEGVFKDESS